MTISDETPLDEHRRDELLEAFQTHYHARRRAQRERTPRSSRTTRDDEEDEQEVGREERRAADGLGEAERQRQDDVDREQLEALEPVRLALAA